MNRFAATRRVVGASVSLAAIILVASTCGGEKSFSPPQPASLSRSAGDVQTGTAGQPLPSLLEVKVVDGTGAPVSGVSVSWFVVSGGGSVNPATSMTGSTGLAQTSWKLGRTAGANVVSASLPGSSLIPPITFSANGTAAAPAALAFTVPPTTATAGSAMTPALQVTVQDSMGNAVGTATNNVTVAIGSNPAGGTLTGTASTAAVAGVATFSTLSINKAGNGYTLTASASGLAGATSAPFAVNAGAAAKLAFTTQPSNVTAGAAISPAVAVTVQDAMGNTVTGASNSITLAIGTNPSGGTLGGTPNVAAVSGVATFSTLSVNKAGTGYTLTAAASGLTGATSGTFNVAVGSASQLVWTQQPSGVTAGSSMSPAVALSVADAQGNLVTTASGSVSLALTAAGGATLSGGGAATVANGVATFSALSVNKSGSYTLTPSTTVSGVTTLPVSGSFTVGAGAAAQIAVNAGNNQSAAGGTAVSVPPSVLVTDALGNPVSGVGVTFGVAGGGGTVVPTTAVTTNASGIAQATSWTLGAAAGTNTLTATSAGLTGSPVTFTATGTAGAATQIAINAGNGQSATAGTAVTVPPSVIVRDGNGNPVSGVSVTFAVASGGGTVVPTTAVTTNASGIAQATSWTLGATAGANTLTATSAGLTGSPLTFSATGTVGAATQIALKAGSGQSATVGTAVAIQPSVVVTDAHGNPVSGVSVTFAVATGGGTVVPTTAVTTNASGIAQVTSWTLGATAGSNTLTATSTGLTGSPVTITATGTAGAASQIAVNAGNNQSATVGSAVTTPPSVIVKDALGNPVSGVGVTFAVASGGGTVVPTTAVTTNASGIAQVTSWTLGTTAGANTLTATSAGLTGSPLTFTASGTVGVATQIALNLGNNQTATAGTAVAVAPSVIVKDANNNPVAGELVTFAVASGGGTVVPTAAVTTNASGIAQATSWTLGTTAGSNTLSATAPGLTGSPVTFTATGTAGTATQIAINAGNGQSATVGTAVAVPPSVIVKDANNNPVSGVSVTFAVATGGGAVVPTTAVTTNASGIAQVTGWTLGTAAGSNTLTATSAGLTGSPLTFTATGTAGAASQIAINAGSGQSATVGTAVAVPPSVIVKDANNNPVSGASVTFAVATGGGAVVPTTAVTTNASGIAQVTSWTLGTTAGANTLTATSTGLTGSPLTFTATGTAGAASQIAVNAGNGQSATAGAAVAVPPSVIVRDAGNNPVSGVSVTFAVATGGGTVAPTTAVVTDAGGIAQVTSWTLGTTVGPNSLTATSAGLTGSPVTFTATGTAGAASQIAVNAGNNQTATVGTSVGVAPSVIVRDVNNNPVSGVSVTFAVSSGGGTVAPTTAVVTDAGGIAQATSWTLGATAGTNTLTAVSGSLAGSPVTFTATGTAGAISAAQSTVVASPTTIAAGGTASTITVTAKDANGNPVSGATVVLAATGLGNTLVEPAALTDVNGVATGTLSSTKAEGKTVSATINSIAITQTAAVTVTAGTVSASQTTVVAAPLSIAAGGTGSTITVTAKDANGNLVSGATVVLASTGTGNTLTQPSTTDVNGVATGTLASTVAEGKTVSATVNTVAITQTASVTVTAGAASQIAVSAGNNQSATVGTAVASAPAAIVKDANGNPVSGVSVTFAVATGGGAVVPTTAVTTNPSGIATATSWTLGPVAGSNTLTATSAGLTGSPVTFTATGTAAAAAKLAVGTPAAGAVNGAAFGTQPAVLIQDAAGNTVTTDNTTIVTMGVSSGATTVGSTLTATAVAGVATFSGVGITGTVGTAYTLTFSSGSLTPATQQITPSLGAAAQLVLTTPAAGALNGAAFGTQPVVAVRDAGNNTVTGSTASVTMSVGGGATTVGTTLTVAAVNGVATFSGVGISGTVGTPYTLTFASGGLVSATQQVTPSLGAATQLVLTTPAAGAVSGAAFGTQPVVAIRDAGGNTVTTDNTTTVTMAVSTGATTVPATATATAVSGVATFASVGISGVAGTPYTLTYTSSPALTQTTQSITPTPGAATQMVLTTPASGAVNGSAFTVQPVVTLKDAAGNTTTASGATVTMAVSPGATVVGSGQATTVSGVATFAGNGINGTVGTPYTLTFSSGVLTPVTQQITPTVGLASKLFLSTQAAGAASGSAFTTQPVVVIQDAGGNTVTTSTATVTMTVSAGATTVPVTATATAVAGVATFTGVGISGIAGTPYTLSFGSTGLTPATQSITPTFGLANKLALTRAAAGAVNGAAFSTQPIVTIQDATGNTVANDNSTVVTMAVSAGATLVGSGTATAIGGVATFAGVGLTGKVGTAYTLTFTSAPVYTQTTQSISPAVGAATQLVLTTPAAGAVNGANFGTQPIVAIQDAGGNTVTTAPATLITMTVTGGDGKATTFGTTTRTTASGVATWSGGTSVGITGTVGQVYTLSFAGGTYTSATETISPTIGAASKLSVTRAAAGAASGSAFTTQPQIAVLDAGGNTVTTSTATVTMTVTAGASTIPATATATAVGGVATFSGVGLTGTAGNYTLTFSSAPLTAITQPIALTGAGTQLALNRSAAGAAAGAAFTTQPIVQIRDAANNLVTGDNTTVVTVAVTGADGKGVIVGAASATAVAGVATFTNVGVTGTAGQVYTLTYTSAPPMTSPTQTITPTFGPATQLSLTTPAATATNGLAFGTEPVVTVLDAGLNTVTNSTVTVTMAVSGADGKATTLGTATKAAVSGVANFSATGAGINGTVGQTYTLTYTSGTLTPITQTISPALGGAAKLAVTTSPTTAPAGGAFSPQPVITVQDAGGNTVTTSTATVAMAVSAGATTVPASPSATAVAGVATFAATGITGTSGTAYVLTFSSAGLTSALDTVTASVGTAAKLGITRLAAGAVSGAVFQQQPIVAIQDAGGNTVSSAPATSITMTVSLPATVNGTASRTTSSGVATWGTGGINVGITGAAGTYTLTFAGGTFTSATQQINILSSAATKVVLTTQPATGAASGSPLPTQPVVQLQDASSANVASPGVVITATASPAGATLTNATATTNASGTATFAGLTITGTAASYTLTFTASGLTSATAVAATALATRLALTTQPPSRAASGNPMMYMPVVQLQDANNANVAVAGVTVTAAIASGSGTITSNTAVSNGTGAATFSGLTLTGTGTDSLKFTSGTMTAAGAIRPTTLATKLAITTQPGTAAIVGRTFNQPFVQVQDAGGNPVDSTGVTVTADVTVHSGGVVLAGNTTSVAFGNTAFFSALAITGASPKYTLVFSAGGLTPATAAAPTQIANFIALKTAPSAVAASGVPFAVQPVVQLVDSSGAVVAVANYGVLATLVNGTAAFADSQQYTDATGTATFNSLSITPTGTLQASYQLRFSTDATPVITGPVMSVATQLALTTQPPLHATSGVALSPQPVVQLQDSNGSAVSLSGVVITPSVSSGTATITNPVTATTASNGRGTFAGLALTGANGTNAQLQFSAGTMTPVVASAATAIP